MNPCIPLIRECILEWLGCNLRGCNMTLGAIYDKSERPALFFLANYLILVAR